MDGRTDGWTRGKQERGSEAISTNDVRPVERAKDYHSMGGAGEALPDGRVVCLRLAIVDLGAGSLARNGPRRDRMAAGSPAEDLKLDGVRAEGSETR